MGEPASVPEKDLSRLGELWKAQNNSAGTAQRVHDALRQAILETALPPGRRLAEEELAEAFGVSRTPIREAITRLEAEGMVERSSVRTITVSRLSAQTVAEVNEVREWLEGVVAYLAAQRITPPGVSEVRWINERMREAVRGGDIKAIEQANREFHNALATAAKNPFLSSLMRQTRDRVRNLAGSTFSEPARAEAALAEHDQIVDLVAAGEAEAAATAARNHMNAAAQVRAAMLESAADNGDE